VTQFFEVISASATHIYHSALELSPLSSIVRRLYHYPSLKLVAGLVESWQPGIAIPNKNHSYISCGWSPCSQFITAQTQKVVEVRDPLTLELLSTLQPTKHNPHLTGPLAYSPSGHSLCCASNTAIVIWDIQTGGLVKEIECGATIDNSSSLVWSLDEKTIGVVLREDHTWAVATYDVTSGKPLCETLASVDKPHLWAHNISFQVMTVTQCTTPKGYTIKIFEVGQVLTQIKTFTISVEHNGDFQIGCFSPISSHISILVPIEGGEFLILNDRNQVLLKEAGLSGSHCFSSDGKLFAASLDRSIHVWRDHHHGYYKQTKFPDQGWSFNNLHLQFSPTSSSLLGHFRDVLQVWHFVAHSTVPVANSEQYINFSPHGTYTVTADPNGSTITINNLISQTPPQFIDVGMPISGLALTNNILLVASSSDIIAWQLTEGGIVKGIPGDRRAGHSDSIWSIPLYDPSPDLCVQGQIGYIRSYAINVFPYNLVTGERYEYTLGGSPPHPHTWYNLGDISQGRYYLHCHKLSHQDDTSEDNQPVSQTAFWEGWVKDPEGKHWLWLPVEWRAAAGHVEWSHYIPILQINFPGGKSITIGF